MIKIREQIIPIYDAAYKILQKDISIKHIQAKDEQLKEMCPDKERTGIEYKEYIGKDFHDERGETCYT